MIRKIIVLTSFFAIFSVSFLNSSYADSILGTSDSDLLIGTLGKDSIFSLAGDDVIMFSSGTDFINGGAGFDTLDYSNSPVGMGVIMSKSGTVRTSSSNAIGPDDVVNNIELIIGTPFSDSFSGSAEYISVIYQGGAGDDYFSNIDSSKFFVSYNDAKDGVLVDLSKGFAYGINSKSNSNIGKDTFSFVNSLSVIGSNFDDKIIGNNYDNTLEGKSGNDFLDARGGNNVIDGGDGIDYCNYDPRGTTEINNCEIVNGVIQILDSDGDYIPDALDECPFDVNKKTPGINGCGVPDTCDFDTTQKGVECVKHHGGVMPANVIIIDEKTTSNIEISNKTLIVSEETTIIGNIQIFSGELFLNDGCVIYGNIESTSSSITIQNCIITGNLIVDGDRLEIINSTIKGNVNLKNMQDSAAIKNSEMNKIVDISYGNNISVVDNHIHETLRVMFGQNVDIKGNQIDHKLILYGNEIISAINNSAEYLAAKYNTQCNFSGNMKNNQIVALTC